MQPSPPSKPTGFSTAIREVPETIQRPLYDSWKKVKQPHLARANVAVTELSPDGTTSDDYNAKHSDKTVLQQHCSYFDLNSDGVITPWETFVAMRLLNWNIFMAIFSAFAIHSALSYASLPPNQFFPDPLFRIYIAHIHNAKHGSDSNTFDNEGRFRPQQLADFFSKYGKKLESGDYGMTFGEIINGLWSQKCVLDFFGMGAAALEWMVAYGTIWPEDGVMRMEDVRGIYDASYFFKVAGKKREEYIANGNPWSLFF